MNPKICILSEDGRVKCVVQELEPGKVQYSVWRHAGAIDGDGEAHNAIMWARDGKPAILRDLPWHVALDRLERCVRRMTYRRPVAANARRMK